MGLILICYLEENQVQETKSSLWIDYKFLGETTKDNLFICDGKGEELQRW